MGLFHHSHHHEKSTEASEDTHTLVHERDHPGQKHATGPDLTWTGAGAPTGTADPPMFHDGSGRSAARHPHHDTPVYNDVSYSGAGAPTGTADPPMFHDGGNHHPEHAHAPRPHKDVTDIRPADESKRHESRDITDI